MPTPNPPVRLKPETAYSAIPALSYRSWNPSLQTFHTFVSFLALAGIIHNGCFVFLYDMFFPSFPSALLGTEGKA